VELQRSTYAQPPMKFEAGTPAIAEVVGLGYACDYLTSIGMQRVHEHELALGRYLYERLATVEGLDLYGPPPAGSPGERTLRAGLVAFNAKGLHASDLAFFIDQEGVAIRTGHHCAQPLHKVLGVSSSARASLYFYNNQDDVDGFIQKLEGVIQMFKSLNFN